MPSRCRRRPRCPHSRNVTSTTAVPLSPQDPEDRQGSQERQTSLYRRTRLSECLLRRIIACPVKRHSSVVPPPPIQLAIDRPSPTAPPSARSCAGCAKRRTGPRAGRRSRYHRVRRGHDARRGGHACRFMGAGLSHRALSDSPADRQHTCTRHSASACTRHSASASTRTEHATFCVTHQGVDP